MSHMTFTAHSVSVQSARINLCLTFVSAAPRWPIKISYCRFNVAQSLQEEFSLLISSSINRFNDLFRSTVFQSRRDVKNPNVQFTKKSKTEKKSLLTFQNVVNFSNK